MFGEMFTVEEIEYWVAFNVIQSAIRYSVDYKSHSFHETRDLIEKERKAQKARLDKSWKKK